MGDPHVASLLQSGTGQIVLQNPGYYPLQERANYPLHERAAP